MRSPEPFEPELPIARSRISRCRIASALADPGSRVYEPDPLGLAAARETISRLWKNREIDVDPSRVVLASSTSEAYGFLFKLLCDPGDDVLVPRPSYPLFEHLARYEGVGLVPYALEYDGAWHVDLANLSRRRTPRTRAIITVNPNNPTGSFLKRSELAAIARLGLPILSDEVFGAYGIGDDSERVASALRATDALVFALDGLSKLAALPQMKLAWVTVGGPDAEVSAAMSAFELIADSYLSPSAPVQHALPALLASGERSRRALRARIESNLASLRRRLARSAATVLDVEGGWYAVVRLPDVKSEEAWVLGLLDDCDVLVQPGFFYDCATEPFAVLSLITPETEFASGVERLATYVDASV
jgi:hypothetical protein